MFSKLAYCIFFKESMFSWDRGYDNLVVEIKFKIRNWYLIPNTKTLIGGLFERGNESKKNLL